MIKVSRLFFVFFALLTMLNSHVFAAGYSVISHTQLKEMVDRDLREFLLIDARNPEEFREAHIPGAINIPQKELDHFAGLLPADKGAVLVFYCNGVKCGKSKKSAKKAIELGYTNVQVFAEGMPVWEETGYPFYKGEDYEKRIETTKLTPTELQKLIETEPDGIQVVDVRDEEEYIDGHIPAAMNLPLNEFAQGSDSLDKKKKIIVYCNSGGRSYGAYRKLMRLGYKDIYQVIFADWKQMGLPVATQ